MLVAALAIFFFLSSQTRAIDAFIATRIPAAVHQNDCATTRLHLARKYIVIGGNIDGINPNKDEEEDTYNMSKKERRRRERERGAAAFKSGAYKQKKKMTVKEKLKNVDFDKLDEQVSVLLRCVLMLLFAAINIVSSREPTLNNEMLANTRIQHIIGNKTKIIISSRNEKQ